MSKTNASDDKPHVQVVKTADGGAVEIRSTSREGLVRAVTSFAASQERLVSKRERWGNGGPEGMARLCTSFPGLRGRPGTDPWDVTDFVSCLGGISSGEWHAARFVLSVWNPHEDWAEFARANGLADLAPALKRFDVFDALGTWDHEHVTAFVRWVELPFWP